MDNYDDAACDPEIEDFDYGYDDGLADRRRAGVGALLRFPVDQSADYVAGYRKGWHDGA